MLIRSTKVFSFWTHGMLEANDVFSKIPLKRAAKHMS